MPNVTLLLAYHRKLLSEGRQEPSYCPAEKSVLVVNGEFNKAIEVVQGNILEVSPLLVSVAAGGISFLPSMLRMPKPLQMRGTCALLQPYGCMHGSWAWFTG